MISKRLCNESYGNVEHERYLIRSFKISNEYRHREKKIQTFHEHIGRIINYYPDMLTDVQQQFYKDTGDVLFKKDFKYEMKVSLNELLVVNPIN